MDMEGNFPEELSARIKARIEIDGHTSRLILDELVRRAEPRGRATSA